MRELDAEESNAPITPNASKPEQAPSVASSSLGSDEEAVLVEGGGPTSPATPGSKKKRKGRK